MNFPARIKVGGHDIRVELVDSSQIDGKGTYDNYHNLIRLAIEPDMPEDNITECFLHEIFEVIRVKNNLSIEHSHLTVLSECLFQVLRDNKLNFGGDDV